MQVRAMTSGMGSGSRRRAWGHPWCHARKIHRGATGNKPVGKQRGELETLPSGSIRVKVYAGRDPVTKRRLYLTETIPPGPKQEKLAEQFRTRFLNEVDEKRNPRTRATVDQLMVKYFDVLDVDASTKRGYRSKYNIHIKPLLGKPLLHTCPVPGRQG
jgi:integrase